MQWFYWALILSVYPFLAVQASEQVKVEGLTMLPMTIVEEVFSRYPNTEKLDATQLVHDLFETGFFSDVQVEWQDDCWQIKLVERPLIVKLEIEGYKTLKKNDLQAMLRQNGVALGKAYDEGAAAFIRQLLLKQYTDLGYLDATVGWDTKPHEVGVAVVLKIHEGRRSKIRRLHFEGNTIFKPYQLKKHLKSRTWNLLRVFYGLGYWQNQQWEEDLHRLKTFYQQNGYFDCQITPTWHRHSNDVDVTLYIKAGDRYHWGSTHWLFKGRASDRSAFEAERIKIVPGTPFDAHLILQQMQKLQKLAESRGYAFAEIDFIPEINGAAKQVNGQWKVTLNQPVWVRYIEFQGHHETNDSVLRKLFSQTEGEILDRRLVERGLLNLQQRDWIDDVSIEYLPVDDTHTDLKVSLREHDKARQLSLSAGYSTLDHFILNAALRQSNFLGSGTSLDLSGAWSGLGKEARIAWQQPFRTVHGGSQQLEFSFQERDGAQLPLRGYALNRQQVSHILGFPLKTPGTEFKCGLVVERDHVLVNTSAHHADLWGDLDDVFERPISPVVQDFVKRYPDPFLLMRFIAGIHIQTLDRPLFPQNGFVASVHVSSTLPFSKLNYFKTQVNFAKYHTVHPDFVLFGRFRLGYGNVFSSDQVFPFFEHYFSQLRGFSRIGPTDSQGSYIGGRGEALMTVGLSLPFFEQVNWVRPFVFAETGQMFNELTGWLRDMKYSVGMGVDLITPFGPLNFGVAMALNADAQDRVEKYFFSMGMGLA